MPTHHPLSIAILSVWLSGLALHPGARADEPEATFHSPTIAAEKALDAAIRNSDADSDMFFFLVKRPRDIGKDRNYSGLFSANLQNSWKLAENKLLNEECGGKYKSGEVCGLDYNPLTCMQDLFEDGYGYRTDSLSHNKASISYRWIKSDGGPIATYRLVRIHGRWLIDGVRCSSGAKFNMD